jgi:5-(carboxyamino)imidazole ribonucleotide synthase
VTTVTPGATVGVLGTGQLGRMLALAARAAGYRVVTAGDGPSPTPCGQVADLEVIAAAGDAAMDRFFAAADVVTVEFENVDTALLSRAPLARPSAAVVAVCQDRAAEKRFLARHDVPTVRFAVLEEADHGRLTSFGLPAVVKTTTAGYDGKGQWVLRTPADTAAVPAGVPVVVEELVELRTELSVVVARGHDGAVATYPVIENRHRDHILDLSVAPARVDEAVAARATALARRVATALDAVGVICVELFVTVEGSVVVNEIAPRPHNSGHLTIEAAATSQFEQQLRAVCGLPLGDTGLLRPAAMANLLGDLWLTGAGEPEWAAALEDPGVSLHLYGKAEPRKGRKMGHLTAVAETADDALERVIDARHRLHRR